ncbi:transient receptor potential cation channel subfamily M member 2-like [Heptranchias perlo]|uniref:transient receptor potential cation channel subfamily M member 2-like n=1 Tax=Heptranchias perlo TaxID=212740 RepID=UPI003559A236
MHIFTVSKTLGPKIIMVEMMMKDIFFFLFLLLLAMVAYGVAKQGILIHNEQRLDWIFQGVVYQPYQMIFGEIPNDVSYSGFDLSQCSVNGSDPYHPKCPEHDGGGAPIFPQWITTILLCLYLLFTNILLLNLLIAMFNYTFQVVQDNTDKIWKFQRYPLIEEYYCRPPAPPPFIIFSHVFLLFELVIQRKARRKHKKFKRQLDEKEDAEVLSWEAIMKENYLIKRKRNQSTGLNQQVSCTLEKVNTVAEILEVTGESSKAVTVDQRLYHLEEQMLQSTRALNWIMTALMEKNFGSRESAPALVISDSRNIEEETDVEEKDLKPLHHVKARSLIYPGSNMERFPVPDEKVPWGVKFDVYAPPIYTAATGGAELLTGLSEWKAAPKASSKDGGADRLADTIAESDRNPRGRTGLRGKGSLRCFGPNHAMYPIITRFKRNSDDCVPVKGPKSLLEFLVVRYPGEDWDLPAGILDPGETFPKSLKLILNPKILDMFQNLLKEAIQIYSGYVDDPRNTDDAWIETQVLNFHLEDENPLINTITSRGPAGMSSRMKLPLLMEGTVQQASVQWQVVKQGVPVCVLYKDYLQRVAEIQGAYF